MTESKDYYKTTLKGDLLISLAEQDGRIAHPATFTRIIDDPISSWLFNQLFLFLYAEKISESEVYSTLDSTSEQNNSCLSKLFYWQEYGKIAVLREGVTTEIIYNSIVNHL